MPPVQVTYSERMRRSIALFTFAAATLAGCGGGGVDGDEAAARLVAIDPSHAGNVEELAVYFADTDLSCDLGRQESMLFAIAREERSQGRWAQNFVALCPDVDLDRLSELSGVTVVKLEEWVSAAEG